MRNRYLPVILFLAAVWGASYLFIKVGVRDFEPSTLILGRLVIALVPLFGFLALTLGGVRAAARALAAAWRPGIVLGLINVAVPFMLIAWGEKHIDSGVAAMAQASVPIFVALLALRFKHSERPTQRQLAGIVVGLAGVGVLTGVAPQGGWWAVAGTLAVVGSSVAYAAGGLYGQTSTSSLSGPVLATASTLYGAIALLPWGIADLPDRAPGWKSTSSMVALALLSTVVGQLLLFHVLRLHGAAKLSLVTYLIPPIALFYGATILDEPVRWPALVGLVLILLGVALGSGVLRVRRRKAADDVWESADAVG